MTSRTDKFLWMCLWAIIGGLGIALVIHWLADDAAVWVGLAGAGAIAPDEDLGTRMIVSGGEVLEIDTITSSDPDGELPY